MTAPTAAAPALYHVTPDRDLVLSMHPGQERAWASKRRFVVVLAGSQGGKALALDTSIPTPDGFVEMADLVVGHTVLDEQGQPTRVTMVSPIWIGNRCYRLTFDDGTTVVADADHQWLTEMAWWRKAEGRRRPHNPDWVNRPQCQQRPRPGPVTTASIAEKVLDTRGASNHAIPLAGPFDRSERLLPVAPYILGAWLGDGTSTTADLTTADAGILAEITAEGETVGRPRDSNAGKARLYRLGSGTVGGSVQRRQASMTGRLNALGLLGNKHIPAAYLFAAYHQRLALLQGLMDTDGSVAPDGHCEISLSNPELAEDVATLAASLGIKVHSAMRYPQRGRPSRRLTFTTVVPVFRLSRKRQRLRDMTRPDTRRRYIVACEEVPSVPVRCITVDSPSHQYLCTRSFVPTHNTSWGPLWLWREICWRGSGDYLAVTSTHPLMQLKMLPEFLALFQDTLHFGRWHAQDKVFAFKGKAPSGQHLEGRVIFGSATNPESLESATAKAAWLDEAGQDQFRLQSWEAIQRRLTLHEGRVLVTTTPYNLGWVKGQLYDRWRSGDPTIDVVQFPSTANPAFPTEEFARMRDMLPAWKFSMFYEGQFERPATLIYSDFDPAYREAGGCVVHAPFIPAAWPRHIGIDYGAVNTALVWVARDPAANTFTVYDCSLEGGLTTGEHAAKALAKASGTNVLTWHGGSKSETQQRWDWASCGIPALEPEVSDVESGIDRVIALFKSRRLYVSDACQLLLDELGTYQREADAQGNPTEKIKDKATFHVLDALRYVAQALDMGEPAWGGRDRTERQRAMGQERIRLWR